MKKQKVFITGASRGIGHAIAVELLERGFEVIGTSRNPDTSLPFPVIQLDLGDSVSIRDCAQKAGHVDILINNAGVSQMGPVEEMPVQKIKELFETNLFGLIELTQQFLPEMRKKRHGFIINVGSLAGKFAVPFKSSYVASKFALAGLSWSLRNEVMPFGIKVTVIEPTDIHTTIEPELLTKAGSEYGVFLNKVKHARSVSMRKALGPEVVAKKIACIINDCSRGDKQPAPFYAAGKNGTLMVTARRLFPDAFVERMVKKSYGL